MALVGLGRFQEAIPEYQTALEQSPKLLSTRLNLAIAYYKMGRIRRLHWNWRRFITEDPSNHQATLLLGDCYMRLGKEEEVIRVLEPEEKKYPDDLAICYLLGTALIRQKRVDEGQVLVDRILRNGDSAEAHLMLGTAKMNVSDFAGARDEFAKAVALNPNLADAHALYAKALMMTGDSDLSAKEFKAELAVEPYSFEANLQLGADGATGAEITMRPKNCCFRAEQTRPG